MSITHPSDIPSYYADYDLHEEAYENSTGTTEATVGNPVGSVPDQAGNHDPITQSTSSNKPTLEEDANGWRYFSSDGVDDALSNATFLPSSGGAHPFHFVVVYRRPSDGRCFIGDGDDRHVFADRNGSDWQINAFGTQQRWGKPTVDTFYVWDLKVDGANSSLWVNGVEIESGSLGSDPWAAGLEVFAPGYDSTEAHGYRLVAFDDGLTEQERSDLYAYLDDLYSNPPSNGATAYDLTGTVVSPGGKTASELVVEAGPEIYLPLDESSGTTAVDVSGNGHDATYVGMDPGDYQTPGATGSSPYGARLDYNPRVDIGSGLDFIAQDNAFSFEGWFKIPEGATAGPEMSDGAHTIMVRPGDPASQFVLMHHTSAGVAFQALGTNGGEDDTFFINYPVDLTGAGWVYIGGTATDTTAKLYLNGTLVGEHALPDGQTMDFYDVSGPAELRRPSDEVAFYKGVLPASHFQSVWEARKTHYVEGATVEWEASDGTPLDSGVTNAQGAYALSAEIADADLPDDTEVTADVDGFAAQMKVQAVSTGSTSYTVDFSLSAAAETRSLTTGAIVLTGSTLLAEPTPQARTLATGSLALAGGALSARQAPQTRSLTSGSLTLTGSALTAQGEPQTRSLSIGALALTGGALSVREGIPGPETRSLTTGTLVLSGSVLTARQTPRTRSLSAAALALTAGSLTARRTPQTRALTTGALMLTGSTPTAVVAPLRRVLQMGSLALFGGSLTAQATPQRRELTSGPLSLFGGVLSVGDSSRGVPVRSVSAVRAKYRAASAVRVKHQGTATVRAKYCGSSTVRDPIE